MKVIKDTKTGLLLKSFLLDNQDYLSISIFYYFDLNNPNEPLSEQRMYKETRDFLGKSPLDYAMPKLKAEVLLSGFCHNDKPQEGASHVRLKVGETIDKELYVFGERKWQNGLITKPLPFEIMPIDYAHAIAKDDFLPNIEDPHHLITSKDDRYDPASFLPIDIFNETNMKKLGTFNDEYKQKFWPGFAADMDYTFFNIAPQDQIQDQFFTGNEEIKILNMNQKKKLIESFIPTTSFRCFVTKGVKKEEEIFEEITLQRDTLWLFPEIEKGIVIFRGTCKTADEIYSDIDYLNIKPVYDDEKSKALQEYHTLQKKELNKISNIDTAAFEKMEKEINETKKEIFNIPREVQESLEKAQNKRPRLQMTPEQRVAIGHQNIDNSLAQIEKAKQQLINLKKSFGHIVKIDVDHFDSTIQKLQQSKQQLTQGMQEIQNAKNANNKMKKDALKNIEELKKKEFVNDEMRENMDLEFLQEKEKFWNDYALEFVSECVYRVQIKADIFHNLRHLGLKMRTIKRAFIGYNDKLRQYDPKEWNLDTQEKIILPKGIVTARFEDATLISLHIDGKPVKGSDEDYELFLTEGNEYFPLFYTKNDLEAHLCDQEVFDICNSLACDDISKVTQDKTKNALKKASVIFYLQEDGVVEKLPQARKLECEDCKNLFELHQNQKEIRDIIIQNLPKNIKEDLPIEQEVSVESIQEKIHKSMDKIKEEAKATVAKMQAELQKELEDVEKSFNDRIDTDILKQKTAGIEDKKIDIQEHIISSYDTMIQELQQKAKVTGIDLSSEIDKLQKAKEWSLFYVQEGKIRRDKAMEKINALKEKAKDPIPDWAKKMMQNAGIDPNNPQESTLSREKVIQMHAEKKPFTNKNFEGLDLSNLDLSGIDLSMANCKGVDFTNTNLSNANLKQTNCSEANFSKANLSNVQAKMTLFSKTVFDETFFGDIKIDTAFFEELKIKKGKFYDAVLDGAVFQNVTILDSDLKSSSIQQTTFITTSIQNSDFSKTKLKKILFSKSIIKDILFEQIDATAITFNKTILQECDFSHSRFQKMRLLKQSSMESCSFAHTDMQKSTIFEGTVLKCQFQRADLSKTLIKKSEVKHSDFTGTIAKGSRFEYSLFLESLFVGINLFRGSLRRMDLKICDFSDANLYGVEFYKAKFYEVDLSGANLKRSSLENKEEFIYD